jgi:hypothetical protein
MVMLYQRHALLLEVKLENFAFQKMASLQL